MKIVRWLLRIALVVLLLMIAIVGFFIFTDSLGGDSAEQYTNVSYTAEDGTTLRAYVTQPPDSDDTALPAVIMVHEWWGLNAEIVEMADMLAEEGYVVLAPDTYRGNLASTVPGALFLRISAPRERVDSDMQAAYDYLAADGRVDASRIGVIGFCYGGGVALRHALANGEIVATVNLYGDTVDDPAGFGALLESGAPVLGIFGAEDQQIPVVEAEAFDAALDAASIPNEVTIYPGVGHAFVNPETIAAGGAAAEAWVQIVAFFEAELRAEA
jgi:carboxymethylenebutenolidase